MRPTLYVADLDGTLLDDRARLSGRSQAILSGLLTEGLRLAVASARSVVAMQKLLAGLPVKQPVIEFNGAFLSELGHRPPPLGARSGAGPGHALTARAPSAWLPAISSARPSSGVFMGR